VVDNAGSAFLADHFAITPGFLRAMSTRLLEGRYFNELDRAGGQQVAIVDELLASSMWPGKSAIGKRIESEHFTENGIVPVWAEIVGVVEHIRAHELSKKLRPEIFLPFEQSARTPMVFAVQSSVDPLSLTAPIREMLRKAAPAIPLSKVRPMTAYLESAKAPVSFTALLAGIFGALALLLAGVGIYGVVQYSVSSRMHEMGVRMALGARGSDIKRLVLKEGLILTTIGTMLGVGAAFALSREVAGLTYGIKPVDPVSYGAAIVVIFAASLTGCWRPASKAATANPLDTIRLE
jgi:putative ABC transport system permease protein